MSRRSSAIPSVIRIVYHGAGGRDDVSQVPGQAHEAFAAGERVKAFSAIERQANRRLTFLENADSLQAIAAYPSNRFEALKGDRQGKYSIRINDQWRICFEWPSDETGPVNIEIVDYH